MTDRFEGLARALRARVAGKVEAAKPLARLTTYRLGGPASLYVEPVSAADVEAIAEVVRVHAARHGSLPLLALGRGSNLVISDDGFPGLVLRLDPRAFSGIHGEGSRGLRAGGATSLPLLANWAARRSLSGLEFLVAIPGSVGGAVRMNAGAHGRETGDALGSATVYDFDAVGVEVLGSDRLRLDYRSSALTERDVVLEAAFRLEPAAGADIRARMERYRRHRAETQPPAVQNAGSTFKNPPGDHAGRLVEAAGLKGLRVGGASVSRLHANFFVTDPGASAQDVYDLVHVVRERVRSASGVELEPEIRFVGAFRDPARPRAPV